MHLRQNFLFLILGAALRISPVTCAPRATETPARKEINAKAGIVSVENNDIVITNKVDKEHRIVSRPDGTIIINCRLGQIVRYGANDHVLQLSVGGKQFKTLKSTIASCPRMVDLCYLGKMNKEMSEGGKVFIDRDPELFPYILTFLRNRVEGISIASVAANVAHLEQHVHLPNDRSKLRDLFVEAKFFGLEDLQEDIRQSKLLTSILGPLLGEGNPFDGVSKIIKGVQKTAVAAGGLATTVATVGGKDALTELVKKLPFVK